MAQSNGIDAENGNTNGNGLVSVVSEESRPPGRVRSVSYWSLPHKGQLVLLLLARVIEPLITSSIHTYMYYQLQYFDPSAPTSVIASQSGILVSARTALHVCTGLLWGRLADDHRVGRKKVLILGLVASSICTLGYGFSGSFGVAVAWQALDGASNCTIAMVRCMLSELYAEKGHRARAVTLLPLCANIGTFVGPLIGGLLAQLRNTSQFTTRFPFALPNIVVSALQLLLALLMAIWLSETSSTITNKKKPKRASSDSQSQSQSRDETAPLLPQAHDPTESDYPEEAPMAFRHIWTTNVITTMFALFVVAGHLGTFHSLWAIFLSSPISDESTDPPNSHHLLWSGGMGLQPWDVGIILSFVGLVGILLQISIYPRLLDRFGMVPLWRAALYIFPAVYFLAPFCALVASALLKATRGSTDETVLVLATLTQWVCTLLIVLLFVLGRSGIVPATTLLINECTPHPSARGTIHTAGVVVSNLSRSVFPLVVLAVYGFGVRIGAVALGFWFLAILAVLSCVASRLIRDEREEE